MSSRVLDIDNIARIGLLFLDGDTLEEVYLDERGAADYDFMKFTEIRRSLLMIEKINPDLKINAVAWRRHPDNPDLVVPAVNGSNYAKEGFFRSWINAAMKAAFDCGVSQRQERTDGSITSYYPISNSDAELVGILELTVK